MSVVQMEVQVEWRVEPVARWSVVVVVAPPMVG
jgi:hypothetical protein